MASIRSVTAKPPKMLTLAITTAARPSHFAPGTAALDLVNQFCFEQGLTLNHLRLRKKSLETKFFELTQNNK